MMRNILSVLLFLMLGLPAMSQSTLELITDEPNCKFRVFLNAKQQNNAFENHTLLEGLTATKYKLLLSFDDEKVADVDTKVELPANTAVVYAVVLKHDLVKGARKLGRKITKKLNGDKSADPDLQDKFVLKKISETPITQE